MVLAAAFALLPEAAHAAPPEPSAKQIDLADQAFSRGLSLAAAGSWATALAEFERAGEVRMTPQIRFHIARCKAGLGRLVEAIGGMRLAVEQAAAANDEPLRIRLDAERRQLEARAPKLVLEVPGDLEPSHVTIDGFDVGPADFGRPLLRDPGVHVVRMERSRGTTVERSIELAEGQTVVVDLAKDMRPATGAAEPSAPSHERSLAPAIVAGSIGLACLGTAAVFFVMREDAIAELDRGCVRGVCDRSLEPVADRGRTMTAVSASFAVVGVAAIATGVVLYFTGRERVPASARIADAIARSAGGTVARF
jgi:hypothetical protein